MYSLYFSISAFTGLGDGDLFAASPAEALCVILFMLCNVVLTAYCLGTSDVWGVRMGCLLVLDIRLWG